MRPVFVERQHNNFYIGLACSAVERRAIAQHHLQGRLILDWTPPTHEKAKAQRDAKQREFEKAVAYYNSVSGFFSNATDETKEKAKQTMETAKAELNALPSVSFNPHWKLYVSHFYPDKVLNPNIWEYPPMLRQQFKHSFAEAVRKFERELTPLLPEPDEPDPITPEIDNRHCCFIAQTGSGKTSVLRWRTQHLIPQIAEGAATGFIMEPKGTLLSSVWKLDAVRKLGNRVIIIDDDTPVALNVFGAGNTPHAVNAAIDRLERIFGIVTAGLTPLQKIPLTMAIRAMFATDLPRSMKTLKHILRHGMDTVYLPSLPEAVAEFFTEDFKPKEARAIELIGRINGIVANPIFAALFASEQASIDLYSEMQRGTLILVNATASALGGNVELFGRVWLEEIARTITPRLSLPEEKRTPVTAIIDECQLYVAHDLALADILDRAREAKIGMVLAFHYLKQIEDTRVRDAILTNAPVKLAARTTSDIHDLSRAMATEPEFINRLREYEFAYIRPGLASAIKVKFPYLDFTKMPQMTDDEYREMRRRNRERYSYQPKTAEEPTRKKRFWKR